MAVAPHGLAAESAIDVLREGGNALEAMIAAAASIAVVYPHMNSIGGDSFWVINGPKGIPGGIDACGASAARASRNWYSNQGISENIPFRGGSAALTVAGTVSGWGKALALSRKYLGGRLPLSRLVSDAVFFAEHGISITASQHRSTAKKLIELRDQPGFSETFLERGAAPAIGAIFKQPCLAKTLKKIGQEGTDTFYRGSLAKLIAKELSLVGSPLQLSDLQRHQSCLVDPLHTRIHSTNLEASIYGDLYNMVPPSQGLISLMILGLLNRLKVLGVDPEGAEFIHTQVEATKLAFSIRDQFLTDRAFMKVNPPTLLDPEYLDSLAKVIRRDRAAPWGKALTPGDTIWMGVIDSRGIGVSFIQSAYHEFGSGIVLPESGINWQNRGCSFSLNPSHINTLQPFKKPFHTLNAAMARLADGRTMVYGTMGGDGQPQTQATIFTRAINYGDHPQQAIERPRWLLGRTWGSSSDTLKLESRFSTSVIDELRQRGHDVELLSDWDEAVGHAGMIIRHDNGTLQGGFDPRSDGAAIGF